MRNMIALCLLLAIALAAIPTGLGIKARLDASARIAEQAARVELSYQAARQDQALAESSATAAARIGTRYATAAAVILALMLALLIARYRLYTAPIVKVGGAPVARSLITDPAYITEALALAALAIQESTAQRIAYAQMFGQLGQNLKRVEHTTTIRDRTGRTESDERPAIRTITPDQPVAPPPSLAELATRGMLTSSKPLIAGYAGIDPKLIDRSMFHNIQVAGLPATGKTTTIRYVAGMLRIHGGQFLLADPHAGSPESLTAAIEPLDSCFLAAPATNGAQALAMAQIAIDIGESRKAGRDPSLDPIAIFIDELGAVLRWLSNDEAELFMDQLVRIAQEYRKYGIGMMFAGQLPPKGRHGAPLRASIATVYCHRIHADQARLILPTSAARLVEGLAPGQAVGYLGDGSINVLTIPNTTAHDLQIIASLAPMKRPRSAYEAVNEADYSPLDSPKPRSADDTAIYRAWIDGEDISKLAKKRNGGSTSGSGYQDRLREINAICRNGATP